MPLIDESARGFYVISATPFTDDGAMDWTSTDRLMDFHLECGIDGITILATRVDGLDDKGLREMADSLRDRIKSGVVVLGAAQGDRAILLAAVTKDLTARYHAGNIIKQLAPLVGGGGGGRPDFAQAGGKDPSKLDDALAAARKLLGAELEG